MKGTNKLISPLVASILGFIFASDWIGRIVLHIIERREKKKDQKQINPQDIEWIKEGVRALLRNEIVTEHRMYTAMEYCPLADKQNINDIYKAYHQLGGNDIATRLKNEILELPESPLARRKERIHDYEQ